MQRQPGELAGKDVLKRLLKEKAEIPDSKIELILEKHGLGELHSSTPCVANHLNTVLMLDTRDGQFILKVRHRKTHNRALETERIVIEPLRKSTSLPLSELVIFDGDRDAIPYPFVVTSKLPGEPGRAFFETTTVGLRKALSNQLGVVLAAIHGHGRSEDLQFRAPQRSLRLWRETLTAFFSSSEDDFGLEMRAFSPEICGEIEALVQRIPVDTVEEEETLVWGDAAFHNMVVSNGDESIEVTGVFDLESASYGNRMFDLHHVEGDFGGRKPTEVYANPEYLKEFYRGYEGAGGIVTKPDEYDRIRFEVVYCATGIRWWWDNLEILHGVTPRLLDRLTAALRHLATI